LKVSYKTSGSASAWTVLFDETAVAAGPVLPDFMPEFTDTIQEEPLVRSANVFRATRGNASVTLPLVVIITYTTRAAAIASLRTMRALKDTKLDFKVEEGAEVQFYKNGVLAAYVGQPQGITVIHNLSFRTDDVTTEES
jgi:hypothetical protein